MGKGLRSIVVAVDFTTESDVALAEAAQLARSYGGATLHVVHVADPERWMVTAAAIDREERAVDESRERLRRYVREKAREILDASERVQVFLHLRHGDPVDAIKHLCADVDADMVVVGAYPHSGLGRVLHTPVGERLLRESHCPVVIAKPKRYDAVDTESHARQSIQPPCPDCLRVRQESGSHRWWCDRHEQEARARHQYAYWEELPYEMHDSEVMPTGY